MNPAAEWLEADGLGGYATGRADGVRTRRYHALLVAATRGPTGRVVLVSGVDAWVDVGSERVAISSQRYTPDVTHPDGVTRLAAFTHEPWPTWTYALPGGLAIVQELVVLHGTPNVALRWRLVEEAQVAEDVADGIEPRRTRRSAMNSAASSREPTRSTARLIVRPFLAARDAHGEQHENAGFALGAALDGACVTWRPYDGVPSIVARSNGRYAHEPLWYRSFQYDEERARGLPYLEDLASPGTFTFDLSAGPATLSFGAGTAPAGWDDVAEPERTRREWFPSALHRAADAYVVRRGAGRTIVAGYPWFSDWGRDTFIALRGLCVAGDRLTDARDILLEWSHHVSEGMLPNYFPDGDAPPEYNSVDASLWFCIAVHDVREALGARLAAPDAERLDAAVEAIVAGYARGTRYDIRADGTGLLCAGEPGVQLTWMDARVDGREVTPRAGKPVEVQALWINALRVAGRRAPRWTGLAEHAQTSFAELFWNDARGQLFDVVDVDHVRGANDPTCRPNQIFAVGGLPWSVLDGARARRVVDAVERALWTPAGLRSLAPTEPGYIGRYGGDARARDGAYHQGAVWPWLIGAFIDAWVRVRGGGADVKREACARFLRPLLAHWEQSAPGHVGEIADGDAPHTPNGCPFQAWSVGEALRVATRIVA